MEYKIINREIPVCQECGDTIRYGRTDKKFCSEECRYRHNNQHTKMRRSYRRRVLAVLERNHEVLESLLRGGVTSLSVTDAMSMGFVPGFVTSHYKLRKRDEYSCFDIKYIMTSARICSITKISLNLQVGAEMKNNSID